MTKQNLVVYVDSDSGVYALYKDGKLSDSGDLDEIIDVICHMDDVPVEFCDFTHDVLAPGGLPSLPGTWSDNKSAIVMSFGWAKPSAALYLSGERVFEGDDDEVANYFLQTLGIPPIEEKTLYDGNSDMPFATLKELKRYENASKLEDSHEALLGTLASMVIFFDRDPTEVGYPAFPYPSFGAIFAGSPEFGQLPTNTIEMLQDRLVERGFDSRRARSAILNLGRETFRSTTIKFFFDQCSGEDAKYDRERLAAREDFDPKLLRFLDIRPDDTSATLKQFLRSDLVATAVKERIVEMENSRDHPRVTVLAAAEATFSETVGVTL